MGCFFFFAYLNIIMLAVYGYYIPANVRVGLSVPQVATTLSCLFFMFALNSVMMKGAKQMGPIEWGRFRRDLSTRLSCLLRRLRG